MSSRSNCLSPAQFVVLHDHVHFIVLFVGERREGRVSDTFRLDRRAISGGDVAYAEGL